MPPKVGGIQNDNHINRYQPIVKKNLKPDVQPETLGGGSGRCSEINLYGSQQRERLERLLVPGLASVSIFRDARDVRLAESTVKANNAYQETYLRERNALVNPSSAANPPKSMVEVSRRAEAAYSAALGKDGFTPLDVRGISVVKAAEFLRSQSKVGGDFTTLSPDVIRQRLGANQETKYFARILDQNHLTASDAKFSRKESPHTWVATPEEIAGAKLDTYETMKRVGYSDDYISWVKDEVAAKRKNLSDFILAVSEADGTSGKTKPSWDVLIKRASTHENFTDYPFTDKKFSRDVQNLDYRTELAKFKKQDAAYLKSLSPYEKDVFNARRRMDSLLGVNEFFTNDGRTARTDGQNGTYGVREFLIDNTEIQNTRRTTFVELGETNRSGLKTTNKVPEIPDNIRSFRNETRNGALVGGAISAATSLPQVFEQYRAGDYTGAAQTFLGATATGAGVGAFSSAGEQIVGGHLTNQLSRSTFVENTANRLYANGAARNFFSRMAGTEASNISSQTFNSTVRTFAGRMGGAGIVGGLVSGGFSAYDQIGAYNRGEVTGSQAIGTIAGETAVGVGSGLAGAAAGAAIGSIVPGVGTVVGAVVGFGVGWLADGGLRALGVDKAIAHGVTATIDAGAAAVESVQEFGRETADTISSAAETVTNSVSNAAATVTDTVNNVASDVGNAVSGGLKSVFGW